MNIEDALHARTVPMRISVAQARTSIAAGLMVGDPPVERVAVADALGRRLAEDVCIGHALPPFANSAMDGYACRHSSLAGGGEPELRVVGESRAGHDYRGSIGAGECVRISTGSTLPGDADTVVIQENVVRDGDRIRVLVLPEAGANVRQAGDECAAGSRLLARFDRLDARALALAASAGRRELRVLARPRVAIVTTGDELVLPGQPLPPGRIYDSNAALLQALVCEAGGQPLLPMQAAADDPAALLDVLERTAAGADLVLTTGGASVGDHDHLPRLLLEHGSVHFWKVRMKPGMPVVHGALGGVPVLALPGNPVSVYATFRVLALPAIAALQGLAPVDPPRWQARLDVPLRKSAGRAEYLRAVYRIDADGRLWVRPLLGQESHRLLSLSQASALLVLPEAAVDLAAGALVVVEPLSLVAGDRP